MIFGSEVWAPTELPLAPFKWERKRPGRGTKSDFIIIGASPGILSLESRDDDIPVQATRAGISRVNFADLLAQAEEGYVIPEHEKLDIVKADEEKKRREEAEEEQRLEDDRDDGEVSDAKSEGLSVCQKVEPEEYNPEQPYILSAADLMNKINALNERRAQRDATSDLEHNPHFLDHALAGAPYTKALCKKCTKDRRCKLHREVYVERTSVSLCRHIYLNLHWAVNDPVNEKCTWQIEIKSYDLDTLEDKKDHKQCKVLQPSERVKILAERFVADLRDERITRSEMSKKGNGRVRGAETLRGSTRRARKEIYNLVGAWEAAKVRVEIEQEKKAEAEAEAKRKLEEALRAVVKIEEKKARAEKKRKAAAAETEAKEVEVRTQKKKKRKLSDVEQSEGAVSKKVRRKSPERTVSTSPESQAYPTPEPERPSPKVELTPEAPSIVDSKPVIGQVSAIPEPTIETSVSEPVDPSTKERSPTSEPTIDVDVFKPVEPATKSKFPTPELESPPTPTPYRSPSPELESLPIPEAKTETLVSEPEKLASEKSTPICEPTIETPVSESKPPTARSRSPTPAVEDPLTPAPYRSPSPEPHSPPTPAPYLSPSPEPTTLNSPSAPTPPRTPLVALQTSHVSEEDSLFNSASASANGKRKRSTDNDSRRDTPPKKARKHSFEEDQVDYDDDDLE